MLSDPDESVRVAAAKAIGIHADTKAVEALIHTLSDENGFVVTASLETLGKMKTDRSKEAILNMLDSRDDEIKRTAINALSLFEGIVDRVIPFLRDPDWATRKVAVEVLGTQRDERRKAILETLYDEEEDPTVRKSIEVLLGV